MWRRCRGSHISRIMMKKGRADSRRERNKICSREWRELSWSLSGWLEMWNNYLSLKLLNKYWGGNCLQIKLSCKIYSPIITQLTRYDFTTTIIHVFSQPVLKELLIIHKLKIWRGRMWNLSKNKKYKKGFQDITLRPLL